MRLNGSEENSCRVGAGIWTSKSVSHHNCANVQADLEEFEQFAERIPRNSLVFLSAERDVQTVGIFLKLLAKGIAVALLDPNLSLLQLRSYIGTYRPSTYIGKSSSQLLTNGLSGYIEDNRVLLATESDAVHPNLSVVLFTSGSTGSPRSVRLSRKNIEENALQIASSLNIDSESVGLTSLPLHYSFGMSIVTSHAIRGATIAVTDRSLLQADFWDFADDAQVTFIAGVPSFFQLLKRLGLSSKLPESIEVLAQAGGRLDNDSILYFTQLMAERSGAFFVMYGQTEAAPRMACLHPSWLPGKLGSVGRAIPSGRFEIWSDAGKSEPSGTVGEIVFFGPNVMMGYADGYEDLKRDDEMHGCLRTGDVGYLDDDEFLFITGRLKRFTKVSGVRVSLDDIEAYVGERFGLYAPVIAIDQENLAIVIESGSQVDEKSLRSSVSQWLGIHISLVKTFRLESLPHLASGKPDYQLLSRQIANSGS